MNSWLDYGILLIVMGFRSIPHQRFRLLCRLLAAFWSLTTLLGALQMAVCNPNTAPYLPQATASRALCRCPMCGHLHRVGMKCCCCPTGKAMKTGQMTLCASCGGGNTHTVAALVWSDPALVHATQSLTLPPLEFERLAVQASPLRVVSYTPFPRPPASADCVRRLSR